MSAAPGEMSSSLQPAEQQAAAAPPAGTAGGSAGAPKTTSVKRDTFDVTSSCQDFLNLWQQGELLSEKLDVFLPADHVNQLAAHTH